MTEIEYQLTIEILAEDFARYANIDYEMMLKGEVDGEMLREYLQETNEDYQDVIRSGQVTDFQAKLDSSRSIIASMIVKRDFNEMIEDEKFLAAMREEVENEPSMLQKLYDSKLATTVALCAVKKALVKVAAGTAVGGPAGTAITVALVATDVAKLCSALNIGRTKKK